MGATQAQFERMLQNLLADRLKLRMHREERDVRGYALVVGKNGPKLQPPATAALEPPAERPKVNLDEHRFVVMPPGQPLDRIRTYRNGNHLFSMGTGRGSMDQLAVELTRALREPVENATGIEGQYEFVLYWALGLAGRTSDVEGEVPAASDGLPTLGEALRKLGLRLEPKTVTAGVWIVDHIEKFPTEN